MEILYIITTLTLLIGITLVPISKEKQNIIGRSVISIVILFGINIFISIITYLLKINKHSIYFFNIIYNI